MRKINPTVVALLGGVIILILLLWFFAATRNPDQDKLTDPQLTETNAPDPEKLCASKATSDLMKRQLFRQAAQLRGRDQPIYERLAAYALIRLENPVMEGEDASSGGVNCSASVSLDLPPGVAVAGGHRTLTAEVDYGVQEGGGAVTLRSADGIIAPLATLARISEPAPVAPSETNEVAPESSDPLAPLPPGAAQQEPPATSYPGRPSFDCSKVTTRGEIMVCQDAGLSALDVTMRKQMLAALAEATPEQRRQLMLTRGRFLSYRDRCATRQCIGDAYVGRIREIRDIMEGRFQPQ